MKMQGQTRSHGNISGLKISGFRRDF